jgi:hypothetical protein
VTWRPCKHKTYRDHTLNPEVRPLIWRCTACGKTGVWTETWSYFGSIECRICWTADMLFVACSAACLEKLKPRERSYKTEAEKRRAARKAAREKARELMPPKPRRKPKKVTPGWICVCGSFNDCSVEWVRVCVSCGVPCPGSVTP